MKSPTTGPRPNAFVHAIDELRGQRVVAQAQQGSFNAATRLVFDQTEGAWAHLDVLIARKLEERGHQTWSTSSVAAIRVLEDLRAAYRIIARFAEDESMRNTRGHPPGSVRPRHSAALSK